jgi:hypothetical protein
MKEDTKTKTKHVDAHFVSQCEPWSVDTKHAVVVEAHGVPMNADTTKDQAERKHEQPDLVEKGSIDNRKTVNTAVSERHIKSEPGFTTAARRSAYVKQARKQSEKVFKK